jgi:hypothetical protein
MSTKYQPLAEYLVSLDEDEIQLSFDDVEQVLGSKLPDVASNSNAFWANSKTDDSHIWSHLWQAAGWETFNVNLTAKKLGFRRSKPSSLLVSPSALTPKQIRILQYLSGFDGWATRKEMEDATGPKGFSKAIGAPTAGEVLPLTLEGLKLVERAVGSPPFAYRITDAGKAALAGGAATASKASSAPAHFALVLTENEVYAGEDFGWADKTGEHYEFPNRYKSLVVSGTPFIYYKGRRRADGTSASPEYYGHGVIGEVALAIGSEDAPAAKRNWTASIASWSPFDETVPFQAEDGRYLEAATAEVPTNYWRDGVRRISRSNYLEVLLRGGATPPAGKPAALLVEDSGPLLPAQGSLIKIVTPDGGAPGARSKLARPRRSKQATVIGTAAEKLFYELLRSQAPPDLRDKIRWVAQEGLTPGYDIQDDRDKAEITAYEVKGTTGSSFRTVDITANEMSCAFTKRSKYALVLVSGVGSLSPRYQVLPDLASRLEKSQVVATPSVFSLAFNSKD